MAGPIPAFLCARLAVDGSVHGHGAGSVLPKDVWIRTLQTAQTIGTRVPLVPAKDKDAKAFHEHVTCASGPSDPYPVTLITKDLRHHIAG